MLGLAISYEPRRKTKHERKDINMNKIKVIIKEPYKLPRSTNISDSLENLQRTIDGYIETVKLASDCVIIFDEEGRIKWKPHRKKTRKSIQRKSKMKNTNITISMSKSPK